MPRRGRHTGGSNWSLAGEWQVPPRMIHERLPHRIPSVAGIGFARIAPTSTSSRVAPESVTWCVSPTSLVLARLQTLATLQLSHPPLSVSTSFQTVPHEGHQAGRGFLNVSMRQARWERAADHAALPNYASPSRCSVNAFPLTPDSESSITHSRSPATYRPLRNAETYHITHTQSS